MSGPEKNVSLLAMLLGMALLHGPQATATANAINNNNNNTTNVTDMIDNNNLKNLLPTPKERIVGGTTVDQGAYPFMVQWMKGCGGSLIHDDIVLTAGHCLHDMDDLWYDLYIAGHASGTGQQRTIIDHVFHPRYDFENEKAYDFLLLKLNQPVDNPHLIELNSDPHYPSGTETFRVIGFGHTKEDGRNADYLQEVSVPHIPDCNPYYPNNKVNPDIAFCSGHTQGGRDSCQADSGGALFHPTTQLQVGLVSWGRGCARKKSPGVYARVSAAYSWIHHQICELSAVPPAHCVQLRVEITMDNYPEETEWALLDQYGQETMVRPRGSIEKKGLTTTTLSVPAGSYRFYMNDNDGVCCDYGTGGIVIYQGDNNQEVMRHSGVFQKDLLLDLDVVLSTTTVASAKKKDDTTTFIPSDLTIPATPSLSSESSSSSGSSLEVMRSSLRVEIFHDMHPDETGWFLINTDTNDEIYASRYNSNNRIPANSDKAMTLAVEEFEDLQAGNYWFVIADAAQNGICCDLGDGYVRILQVIFFESSEDEQQQQQRDDNDRSTVILEERVLWEHSGKFNAFAEAHFVI